jgi:hypothetical protein
VDPITGKIVASVTGSLLGQAGKPISGAVRDALLGKPETKAAEKSIRRAIDWAVEESCAEGMPPEVIQHVLLMLHKLVQDRSHLGADALRQQDDDAVLRQWTQAAEATGWDLARFPVQFPDVVQRITARIPHEMRCIAGEAESPLHNRVVLSVLEKVESQLTDLQRVTTMALSRDVPIADPLRQTLEQVKATCRATGTRFLTPHLLLALLRPPFTVRALFDDQRPGLTADIESKLARYVSTSGLARFADFDWRERRDIQAARVIAIRQGAPVLTDRLVLVGILETPSSTNRQLAAWLGDGLLGEVKRNALIPAVGQTVTPDLGLGRASGESA